MGETTDNRATVDGEISSTSDEARQPQSDGYVSAVVPTELKLYAIMNDKCNVSYERGGTTRLVYVAKGPATS